MYFDVIVIQTHMFGGGHEAAYVGGAGGLPVTQGSMIRYPAGFSPQAASPGQPSTPPVGMWYDLNVSCTL